MSSKHSADRLIGITINQHIALEYVPVMIRVSTSRWESAIGLRTPQDVSKTETFDFPLLKFTFGAESSFYSFFTDFLILILLFRSHRQRKHGQGSTGNFSNLLTEIIVVRRILTLLHRFKNMFSISFLLFDHSNMTPLTTKSTF